MCIGKHVKLARMDDNENCFRNFCVPGSPTTRESVRTRAEQSTKYGKAGYNSFKKLR
jgi:hypothetical protein